MWEEFTVSFQKDYNVVCLDLPGHASAPIINKNHTMSLMADFVKDRLVELKISDHAPACVTLARCVPLPASARPISRAVFKHKRFQSF